MAQKNIFNRTISNPVVHTFLIYISGGWIVLEMTDYFINNYGLSETFRDILLIIMIAGLPVALFISWYLSRDKKEKAEDLDIKPDKASSNILRILFKRPWFSIPGTIIMILIVVSLIRLIYQHRSDITDRRDKIDSEISLAVLPFINLTGNADQEWLVSGLQETLINELSKLSQVKPLRVISRHTVNSFESIDKSIPEIAQEINVDYLVEASVLSFADSITLQLRLIQVLPEESIVLAQTFTGGISNILRLYSNIATQIAQKTNLELAPHEKEKLPSPRTVSPESYRAYLRGMYYLNMDTPEEMAKGLEYLHEAVRLDPGEPFAYAGLAQGYIEIAHGPLDVAGNALIKAEAAANQAIKLDTNMAEIYAAMAEINLYGLWEFEKAERYFIKALELDPNLSLTHWHYAWALYLFGRMEEGLVENELAQKYDPFNPNITAHLGLLYSLDGRHEDAIREALKSLEIEKDYQMGYYALGEVYLAMGRIDEAIEAHQKLVELYPWWKWALGNTYANSGHRDEAEKILNELEKTEVNTFNAMGLTILYGSLGKMDEAFKWLAYEPHAAWLPWIAVIPSWSNSLPDDPRFENFLERLNLPN